MRMCSIPCQLSVIFPLTFLDDCIFNCADLVVFRLFYDKFSSLHKRSRQIIEMCFPFDVVPTQKALQG